jgi:IS5 family transposase
MDTDVVALYCLTDDLLQDSSHSEPPQRSMSDSEVITTALVATRLFGGNFATARAYLQKEGYIPDMLSKSQYNRRLHRAAPLLRWLFRQMARIHKRTAEEDIYLVDSFPASVCKNIRIPQTRIYGAEEGPNEEFRGYIASKDEYFFGVKVHLLPAAEGHPVEAFLTPGARNDTRAMKQFHFDLPEGAVVIGDKAYNDYDFEDLLSEAAGIDLRPLRRKNSTRAEPAYVEYIQRTYRKQIETTGSDFERQLPDSIHAVTAEGFELKVFLFVLSVSFGALI